VSEEAQNVIQWVDQHVVKISGNQIPIKIIETVDGVEKVKYDYIGEIEEEVSYKNSFSVINTRSYTKINGTGKGEWNKGLASTAPTYNWQLRIPITSDHVDLFRAFQLSRLPFMLVSTADGYDEIGKLSQKSVNARNYNLTVETWENCYVVSMAKTPTANGPVPLVEISGVAFRHNYKSLDPSDKDTLLDEFKTPLGSGITEAGNVDDFYDGVSNKADKLSVFQEW